MTENGRPQAAGSNSEKGFTLIELAIVLVIIGIILGAVLKGQDLIESARTKKLISTARQWEMMAWQFYDRKGYFPGASASNSLITTTNVNTDFTTNGRFTDAPTTNSISLGANTFSILFGSDGTRNLMAICVDSACGTAFSSTQLAYAESFDTTIDGSSSGTSGRVFSATNAQSGLAAGNWLAGTGTVTSADWSTSTKGIIYYFDRKP